MGEDEGKGQVREGGWKSHVIPLGIQPSLHHSENISIGLNIKRFLQSSLPSYFQKKEPKKKTKRQNRHFNRLFNIPALNNIKRVQNSRNMQRQRTKGEGEAGRREGD